MKLFPAILAATMFAGTAHAATITITPHSAVNFFGSPSTAAYQANAISALQSGAATAGPSRAVSPTGYEAINGPITVGDVTVSGVTQWRGELNPPPPFNNELGNRLHFGLHVTSDTQFSLNSISFNMTSSDGALDYAGNLAGTTFGATRLGIDYGGNGIYDGCGVGDDICYDVSNPGNDGTLVNELVYVGVGNAYWVPYDGYTLDDLSQYMHEVGSVFVNMTYTVGQQSASASVEVVPEPAALGFMGLGVLGLALRRRRKG